jgi:hypothetical protein
MGITSIYLEADDLMVGVWHGTVSGAEWQDFTRRQLADDPNWPPGKRHLTDLTTFDPSELNVEDLDVVAGLYSDRITKIARRRQAIVASSGWEIARAFERRMQRLGATTVVFNSVAAACNWLGADLESMRGIIGELRDDLRRARIQQR